MDTPYRPVACSLHDELEALATLRRECEVRYRAAEGGSELVARGRIRDIRVRDGAEHLLLDDGCEIRLDRILALDGKPFDSAC